jgi:hypothetical protein
MKGGPALRGFTRPDRIPIGDVMSYAFHVCIENAALRRLVLDMALAVPEPDMPADERDLLASILNGGSGASDQP